MGWCLVQLDEPVLLTKVVLAVVTSELYGLCICVCFGVCCGTRAVLVSVTPDVFLHQQGACAGKVLQSQNFIRYFSWGKNAF